MRPERMPRSAVPAARRSRLLVLGRFDLLTPGLIDFLEEAAARGVLRAGVLPDACSDESIRTEVLYPQSERLAMVAALAAVAEGLACPAWPADEAWTFLSEVDELIYAPGGWVEREALQVIEKNPLFKGHFRCIPRREGWSRKALVERIGGRHED